MQISDIKEHITKKHIQPLYIFTGTEVAIMDIYINKIAETIGTKAKRVDSISSIYSKLQNHSFMGGRGCYVVRDDKDFLTQEKLWQGFNAGLVQGDNIIILIYTSIDKRSKFYKQNTSSIIAFEPMAAEIVAKYIKKEIGLDQKRSMKLSELCENDYSRVLLECNKIKNLSTAMKLDINEAMDEGLRQNIFYKPPKDAIFDLVDAICRRKLNCYDLWEQSKAVGESPVVVVSVLYTNIRSILLVELAGDGEGICNRTGLTPFQVKLAKEKRGAYSVSELITALQTIRKVEKGIKTGAIEQDMAVDYLLVSLL